MAKELRFREEGRRLLQAGVDQLAEAGKSTLGPRGRTRCRKTFYRSLTRLLRTKATFAGRSPSRRMKYGNHSRPNGM